MEERARLQVTGSGELSVNERSLLLCRRGEINLEQAHVTLENASCLIIMESEMNVTPPTSVFWRGLCLQTRSAATGLSAN